MNSRRFAIVGISVIIPAVCLAVSAANLKFDMGTSNSPVWPDCVRVTETSVYSAERGYGWKTKNKLNSCQRVPVDTGGKLSIPDDLWGDFVFSYQDNAFQADLPNGDYEVVALIGDIGSAYGPHMCRVRSLYPSSSIIVKANGREVVRQIIDENNIPDVYYQNEKTEYRRGDCPWRKYIDSKLQPRVFKAKVTDGRLLLEFSPDCRIAGLFVHPAAQSAEFKRWYDAQSEVRRKFFLDRYYEVTHAPEYPSFAPGADDQRRGYVLFSRSYLEEIYPASVPAPDERRTDFHIFAAQGEAECITVGVLPLRELHSARVEPGALAGPGKAVIPASAWDIRHVRYMQVPSQFGASVYDREMAYSVMERLLDQKDKQDFEAGTTRRLWMTVNVPSNAVPGVYFGTIRFLPDNAPASAITVELRVFPFQLLEPKDVAIGIFYSPASPWENFKSKEALYWDDVRRSLALLREHGFNSVAYSIDRPKVTIAPDGKLTVDLSKMDKFFGAFKAAGMSMAAPFYLYGNDGGSGLIPVEPTYSMGWIDANGEKADAYLTPEWVKRFRELLRLQVDYGKAHGWPPIVFAVHDEVHGWSRKQMEGIMKIIEATYRQEPGVKTGGCINNPEGVCLVPAHDYPMYNLGVPITEETLALVHKHGKTVTIDNFGQDRWPLGFWMWRVQPKLAADGFFSWIGADPFNPFDDATASELAVALPGRDAMIPTPTLPRMREGIDDYKYAFTLEQTLQEAERKGGVDAAVLARCRDTLKYIHDIVPVALHKTFADGVPSQEACDYLRWRVARDIAALKGHELPKWKTPAAHAQWWDPAWSCRLPLIVDPGFYTRRDGLVISEIDFSKVLGGKSGLIPDENSLRLVEPVFASGCGCRCQRNAFKLAPFQVQQDQNNKSITRLIWKMNGVTPAMSQRRFYLYFTDGPAKLPPRPKELILSLTEPLPMVNLLQNAGFEEEDGKKPGVPKGWNLNPAERLTAGHSVAVVTDTVKSGAKSLKFVQTGQTDPAKNDTRATYPVFPVLSDRRYRLSGWIKRAEGDSHNEILLWWCDKEKNTIGNRKFDAWSKGQHDWRYVEATATSPQNACFASIWLFIYPSKAAGTAFFDDVSLVLMPVDGHPLPVVSCGKLETPAGNK